MRITQPPAVGLIASHAALESGIHGATGVIATLTDTETLTNKSIGAGGLIFDNEGSGSNPVISSNATSQLLSLTGIFEPTLDLRWLSGTAFGGRLEHNNSTIRIWSFPDVTGTVLIEENTAATPHVTSVTVLNVGAGADPVLASNSASQILSLTGYLDASLGLRTPGDFRLKSATAFNGIFDHAISAERIWVFPDVAGTVCMWGTGNAAVTRFYSIGGYEITSARNTDGSVPTWFYDSANRWAESVTVEVSIIPVHLPHGAIVTALRIHGQETVSGKLETSLNRQDAVSSAPDIMVNVNSSANFEEIAVTSIGSATINNDTHSYYIAIDHSVAGNECRISKIQIDYTVTEPYP